MLLNESLYGLKQALRSWNELLVSKLRKFGLEQCQVNPCIFRLQDDDANVKIMMIIHDDGIVVTGTKVSSFDGLRQYLNKSFCISNLGDPKHYVSCTFECDCKLGTMTTSDYGHQCYRMVQQNAALCDFVVDPIRVCSSF